MTAAAKQPLLLALAALGLALAAQDAARPSQDPAQIQRRMAEIKARLGQVDQQLGLLTKRRRGVLVELQGISLQADRARTQMEGARLQQDQAQLAVRELTAQKERLRQEIGQMRGRLRRQVRWMQAVGPLGGFTFVPTLVSFDQFLVQGRYLTWWRNQERRRLDLVQHLQGDLLRREMELQAALRRLSEDEQEAHRVQAGLLLSEQRLQGYLEGLQNDEERQKQVQAELSEEAIQLERMLSQLLGKARSEAFETGTAFASLRGLLPQPVEGTLSQGFGEHVNPRFKTRTMQTGLLIAADAGTQVQAVAEGKVVFADYYQSYGPMVILDHGSGYFTLYTHLAGFAVAKGQLLHQGEGLGSVGSTLEGPRLGFEIRHMAQPLDPAPWFKRRYAGAAHPEDAAIRRTARRGKLRTGL